MSLGNISSLCEPDGNVEDPIFLSCDPSVFAQLPRITYYIDMYEFYLDPEDYTYAADDSHFNLGPRTFIMVAESVLNADVWILGAPFLQKFPTHFQNTDPAVTVFCVDGITCQTKQHRDLGAKSLESVIGGSSSSSSGASKVSTAAIGFAIAISVGIVLVFAVLFVLQRRRKLREQQAQRRENAVQDFYDRLRRNNVETVASEQDLASRLGPGAGLQLPSVAEVDDVVELVTPPTSYRR
ncbi:hypothetical protein Poli38472_012278 [Pythium oligandrum]|uniref:Uncharacterized protein n=1 Tax=Pythium oligandrum TaxID=41045 RepID=A0A8K1CP51_PYTOL|nr:hypothetical protein Poli38472_012278 [Pythium oligandrum]|eukprot:TMW67162.1 hypothetical protein Poli38472_012278 [Pythium oligandrum]